MGSDISVGALVLQVDGIARLSRVSKEDLTGAAQLVGRCATAVNWWVGDILAIALDPDAGHGMDESEAYQWISEVFPEMSEKTQMQCQRVSLTFEKGTRVPGLSWTHHRIASYLDDPQRRDVLVDAKEAEWSTGELQSEVRRLKHQEADEGCVYEVSPSADPSKDIQECDSWRAALAAVRASLTYWMEDYTDPSNDFSVRVVRRSIRF